MEKFGLIGDPIGHSLSPALFRAGYAGAYGYHLIEGGDFEASFGKFLEEYDGINVTAPFKETAFRKMKELLRQDGAELQDAGYREIKPEAKRQTPAGHICISPECEKTGATNLLVKTGGGISAHNSDYLGLCKIIREHFVVSRMSGNILKEKALIAGCGGAGRAAAVAAADMGFEVCIMNRNIARAEAFRDSLPEYAFKILPQKEFAEAFIDSGLIIYTLPCPIPEIEALQERDICGSVLHRSRKVLIEASYKSPSFTGGTLERMQSANRLIEYVPGTEWLLAQAVTGYTLFTGHAPDTAAMQQVLLVF